MFSHQLQHFVKRISCCLLAFSLMYSCSSPQNQPNTKSIESSEIAFDSIQKNKIETMVNAISASMRNAGQPQKLAYPLYNPSDTILYWAFDDKSARISIEWNLPQEIKWPTFFVYEGELIMVRYRYMLNSPPNSRVAESMIYIHDGKIIYCEERGMPLAEGQIPGILREKPITKSIRSYGDIEKDYREYWETVVSYMEKQNALPEFIKK